MSQVYDASSTSVMNAGRMLNESRYLDELGACAARLFEQLRQRSGHQQVMVLPTGFKFIIGHPSALGTYGLGDATDYWLLVRDEPVQDAGNLQLVNASFMPCRRGTKPSRQRRASALRVAEIIHQIPQTASAAVNAQHHTPTAQTDTHQS